MTAGTEEHIAQEAKITEIEAGIVTLEDMERAGEEEFARMNREDAELSIELIRIDVAERTERLAELNAEYEWIKKQ